MDNYRHGEMYASVDQTVNLNNPLDDIHKAHGRILTKLSCNCNQTCSYDMMIMSFFPAVNAEGETYAGSVHNLHGKKLLK